MLCGYVVTCQIVRYQFWGSIKRKRNAQVGGMLLSAVSPQRAAIISKIVLMAAAQEEYTPDHDEVKFPPVPSKCDAVEVPNIINAPAAKRHCTRAARHDQRGPRNAIILSLDAAMRGERRRRLYVHPIAWTPYHLELLDVYFRFAKKTLSR